MRVEVAMLCGDEVAVGPGSAATWMTIADDHAVRPAIGGVTHLDCLSQVLVELVEPCAFPAARPPTSGQ